jgi:hypothetical protein
VKETLRTLRRAADTSMKRQCASPGSSLQALRCTRIVPACSADRLNARARGNLDRDHLRRCPFDGERERSCGPQLLRVIPESMQRAMCHSAGATERLRSILQKVKLLIRLNEMDQSVQSIMGAMLIFLFKFKYLHHFIELIPYSIPV